MKDIKWKKEEIEFLKSNYCNMNIKDLINKLDRTKYAIILKASKLRIKKKQNKENILIYCDCNCGKKLWKYDSQGRERKCIKHHFSKEHNINIGLSKKGVPCPKGSETLKRMYKEGKIINPKPKGLSKYDLTLMIPCKCGCGKLLLKYHPKWRTEREYINGHQSKVCGFKKGDIAWNKNLKGWHSKETIQKIKDTESITKKKMFLEGKCPKCIGAKGKDNINYGKIPIGALTKEKRAKIIFPVKDTTIEVKIQNFLKQLGIEFFTHQYITKIEHKYQCDIFIPIMNMVIECDGDYWHKYPTGNDIDHIRTSELLSKGFKVLRLWECEIRKMNLNDFEIKLKYNGWRKQ